MVFFLLRVNFDVNNEKKHRKSVFFLFQHLNGIIYPFRYYFSNLKKLSNREILLLHLTWYTSIIKSEEVSKDILLDEANMEE